MGVPIHDPGRSCSGSSRVAAAGLVLLLLDACEPPPAPQVFLQDGAMLEDGGLAATSPSPCFPEGADTLVVGPGRGCAEATVRGGGTPGLRPIGGWPVRIVDRTGGALEVFLFIDVLCDGSDAGYSVFFLETECDRGTSLQGRCAPGSGPGPRFPFDAVEGGHDDILEMLVLGDVSVRVSACAAGP